MIGSTVLDARNTKMTEAPFLPLGDFRTRRDKSDE